MSEKIQSLEATPARIQHEDGRAAEMIVQALQEMIGACLQGILALLRRAQQREHIGTQLDGAGDRRMARHLAIDGGRQNIELVAGLGPHLVQALALGSAVGEYTDQQQDKQGQGDPERPMGPGECNRDRLGGF